MARFIWTLLDPSANDLHRDGPIPGGEVDILGALEPFRVTETEDCSRIDLVREEQLADLEVEPNK